MVDPLEYPDDPKGYVLLSDLKFKPTPLPPKEFVSGERTVLLGRVGGGPMYKIYLKEHKVRNHIPEKPAGRTLVARTMPPDAFEDNVALAFSVYGKIKNVYLHEKPDPGLPPKETSTVPKLRSMYSSVAYIVFETEQGLLNALDLDSCARLYLSNENTPMHSPYLEYRKWQLSLYNFDWQVKHKEAADLLNKMDVDFENKVQEEKKAATEADEEGWVSMTKESRKKGIPRKESVLNKIKEAEAKKVPRKQFNDFYKFQTRETKKEKIIKMRMKFTEDQIKVANLKESKKFKLDA